MFGGGIWLGDMPQPTPVPSAADRVAIDDARSRARELEDEVARLKLLNQALWELLRDKLTLTDADLETRAAQIDMRDGVKDGKISNVALKCPTCGRVSSSKRWKCMYCGQEFEKPAMG